MKVLRIINIGSSGFPHLKSAPVNKSILINKCLVNAGINTLVINNEALLSKSESEGIPLHGFYERIEYQYTIFTVCKTQSPIKKRILRFMGKANEFFYIIKYKFKIGIDAAILLTNGSLIMLIYYRVLSFVLNFKLIIIYHEFRSDFDYRKKKLFLGLNDKLFDRYFTIFVDAVLPISEFLINHVQSISPYLPYLKIPALADFSLYNNPTIPGEKYFMYCGSAGYIEDIVFIIKTFEILGKSNNFKLYVVIGGESEDKKKINELVIKSAKKNDILIYSDLSYDRLISLYCNAKALLAPLKPDIRDRARFPQKIAEYAASGNPIVTTNYGEVKHYFTDKVNALVAETYNIYEVAQKLDFVINNPSEAIAIGKAGKHIGLLHFNYSNYSIPLKQFIQSIL